MLFSRSGSREFKPTRGHLFKGFGNLYNGDPAKIMQQRDRVGKWMHGCGCEGMLHVNWRGKLNIDLTPAMPVIPRTEKILEQLVCCGGGFGGALLQIKCSRIYEISTPPWLRRLRCFSLDLGVASSSQHMAICLKALETFTKPLP